MLNLKLLSLTLTIDQTIILNLLILTISGPYDRWSLDGNVAPQAQETSLLL